MTTTATDRNETWNYRTLIGEGTMLNICYNLTSPRLVLPYLYMAVGAPIIFAGLIVPLVQLSSLISQLVTASAFSSGLRRKWALSVSEVGLASGLAVIGIALVPPNGIWLVVLFLLVSVSIGISMGLSMLAHQDLYGRVLSADNRRNLVFQRTGLAGLFTVGVALFSHRDLADESALDRHIELLWIGTFLAVFSALSAAFIREIPDPVAKAAKPDALAGSGLRQFVAEFTEAMQLSWFRRFFIMKLLFLSVRFATPFYAIHAASIHAGNHKSLGTFVIGSSLGYVVGAVLWPRLCKKSVMNVMAASAIAAIVAGGVAIVMDLDPALHNIWLYALVFLLLALGSQGVGNASSLYIIGFTSDEQRPFYLAISNAGYAVGATGFSLLLGSLAHFQGLIWPIWGLIGMTAIAGFYALRLPAPTPPTTQT